MLIFAKGTKKMRPEAFIASRIFSLSSKKISTTVMRIALLSVALGVGVMIISVSIVIGFKKQIREKVIGFVAPIHISLLDNNESIENKPVNLTPELIDFILHVEGVHRIQPVATKAGIVKTEAQIQGIIFKGVDKDYDWDFFEEKLLVGKIPEITGENRSTDVLISKHIANKLLLQNGDELRVWFIDENQQARGRKFEIVGIYETGLEAGTIEVWLDKDANVDKVNEDIYFGLPVDLASYTASASYPHIFDWLNLQDMNVVIIIILMVLVSGITMISMLLIIILERTSMIGLLKTMGANNRFVRNIFLFHSTKVLFRGLLAGNVIGVGFCILQFYSGILKLPSESYYLSVVPIDLNVNNILLINFGTLVLWFIMLLIPTAVINRILPARSIKFV